MCDAATAQPRLLLPAFSLRCLQYNPSPGLGTQEAISGVTGQHCLVCPEGSLALLDTQAAIDVVDAGMPLGATTCDPW